jgi:prepilin-type N-terminal cleavage/methylation domain-containing protein
MCRGFSLIETLVTVSFISALVGIALPSMATWASHRTVFLESKRLQGALERCYSIAMLRERPITVTLQNSRMLASTSDNHLLFSYSGHHAVELRFKSTEQNKLVFYPSHTVTPATIIVRGESSECSVVISLRGRIRSECL